MAHREPTLTRVAMRLCDPCLSGAGGECHTPGCALWLKRAPDLRLDPATDYEVLDVCWHCGDCLTPERDRPRCERCPSECDVAGCDEMGCVGIT